MIFHLHSIGQTKSLGHYSCKGMGNRLYLMLEEIASVHSRVKNYLLAAIFADGQPDLTHYQTDKCSKS